MMVFFVDMNCDARQGRTISDDNPELTSGIFLDKAILNEECANPVIDYHFLANPTNPLKIKQTNLVCIVHRHCHTLAFEVVNIQSRWGRTILGSEHEL